MSRARNGSVELEFETFGDPRAEAVLLVNGLGSQMTRWPADFCARLAARGYRPIRFDNRDVGLSSWCADEDRYTLADMARDGMAVLDAAGVAKAHIAGVSLGGMVSQRIAIDHPGRTLSLTSIMSTTGDPAVHKSTPEAAAFRLAPEPDPQTEFEAFVAHGVRKARVIGSPDYPWSEDEIRERVIAEWRRAYNPSGVPRQLKAAARDGDRTPALRNLEVACVVLHGTDDPLILPEGGVATADAIPGADLRLIPGMGHDLPPGLHEVFVDAIDAAATHARAFQL